MGYIRDDETETFGPCEGVNETDLAVCVKFRSGEERWIPKSVIDDDSEVYERDTEGTLVVKRWFAEREGLHPGLDEAPRPAAKRPGQKAQTPLVETRRASNAPPEWSRRRRTS